MGGGWKVGLVMQSGHEVGVIMRAGNGHVR